MSTNWLQNLCLLFHREEYIQNNTPEIAAPLPLKSIVQVKM